VSRVGKAPIPIPVGVTLDVKKNLITAKGPKGELSLKISPDLSLKVKDGFLTISRPTNNKVHRSLHGLNRTLAANIIEGVSKGFSKRLEIVGVGFKGEMRGKKLLLSLGFSHQIIFTPPAGIDISMEGNNIIVVQGASKELVGQIGAKIRSFRPPEPYKGKGIRYQGEYVKKKAGKTAA
jgi:large subunit ribosomal protein L6